MEQLSFGSGVHLFLLNAPNILYFLDASSTELGSIVLDNEFTIHRLHMCININICNLHLTRL